MRNFLRAIISFAFFAFVTFAPFATFAVVGDIVINEIAWSGTRASSYGEWIELYNASGAAVSLEGWGLYEGDGSIKIIDLLGSIVSGGYFLIERTTATSPDPTDVSADVSGSFGGAGISNSGERLALKNNAGASVDVVDFLSDGWPAGTAGPDYFSMERIDSKQDGTLASNWASNNGVKINGKDAAGNPINGTPKQENSVYNNPPSSSSPDSSPPPASSSSSSSPSSSSPSHPIYPALKVDAGSDKTVLVGSSVSFSGSALGINGAPLLDARFLWNFGDGTLKEGRAWDHVYYFPGTYTAALTVSSDPYSGSDTAVITAIVPALVIKNTQTGEDGFVTIANGAGSQIDLGGMILRDSAGAQFLIPKNTFVSAKGEVTFPNRVSGVLKNGGTVRLYDAVGREIREAQSITNNLQSITPNPSISETKIVKVSSLSGAQTLNAGKEASAVEDVPEVSQETAAASGASQSSGFTISKTTLFFGASVLIGLLSAAGFFFLKTFF